MNGIQEVVGSIPIGSTKSSPVQQGRPHRRPLFLVSQAVRKLSPAAPPLAPDITPPSPFHPRPHPTHRHPRARPGDPTGRAASWVAGSSPAMTNEGQGAGMMGRMAERVRPAHETRPRSPALSTGSPAPLPYVPALTHPPSSPGSTRGSSRPRRLLGGRVRPGHDGGASGDQNMMEVERSNMREVTGPAPSPFFLAGEVADSPKHSARVPSVPAPLPKTRVDPHSHPTPSSPGLSGGSSGATEHAAKMDCPHARGMMIARTGDRPDKPAMTSPRSSPPSPTHRHPRA